MTLNLMLISRSETNYANNDLRIMLLMLETEVCVTKLQSNNCIRMIEAYIVNHVLIFFSGLRVKTVSCDGLERDDKVASLRRALTTARKGVSVNFPLDTCLTFEEDL